MKKFSFKQNIKKLFIFKLIEPFYWFFKYSYESIKNKLIDFLYPRMFLEYIKIFFYPPIHIQWDLILSRKKNQKYLKNNFNKKIMFVPFYGFSDAVLLFESLVAKSLELRGHSIFSLSCDASLPACQWNIHGNSDPLFINNKRNIFQINNLSRCNTCSLKIKKTYTSSKIKNISLNKVKKINDVTQAEKFLKTQDLNYENNIIYKGINIAEHSRATALRHLLRGTLEDNSYTRSIYYRFLLSSIILTDLYERILLTEKPDRIVASHGMYIEHGILCSLANKLNIPIIIWGVPYRKNCILASHNDTYHREMIHEPVTIWQDIELNSERNKRLDNYLFSKYSGGRDNVNYHPNPILDKNEIIKNLKIDLNKPVVTLYTNVLWDAQIFYESNGFNGILDWIFETIDFFIKKNEIQLVIRIHPAESKGSFTTDQPIEKEISKRYKNLPENVKIIPPESDISSYTLASLSKAALVYGTNLAIELGVMGVPLIIVGECRSRGKGFSFDISDKNEYFEILKKIDHIPKPSNEQIERARKYAYHFFFRRMMDFSLFTTASTGRLTTRNAFFNFDSINSLMPGKNDTLDIICDGIIDLKPFISESKI